MPRSRSWTAARWWRQQNWQAIRAMPFHAFLWRAITQPSLPHFHVSFFFLGNIELLFF